MEKLICNSRRGGAKTSSFARVVALVRKVATSATLPAIHKVATSATLPAVLALAVTALGDGLPTGYTQVPYIQANGNCQIQTGIVPNSTDKVELSWRPTVVSGNQGLWCSRDSSAKNTFTAFMIANKVRLDRNGSSVTCAGALLACTNYTVVADYATLVGVVTNDISHTELTRGTMPSGDYTPTSELCLFASHQGAPTTSFANAGSWACYSFKLSDSVGNLRLNLVPAKRDADGELGLYDLVRSTFLTNCNSGVFTTTGSMTITPSDPLWGRALTIAENVTIDAGDGATWPGAITVGAGGSLTTRGSINVTGAVAVDAGASLTLESGVQYFAFSAAGAMKGSLTIAAPAILKMNRDEVIAGNWATIHLYGAIDSNGYRQRLDHTTFHLYDGSRIFGAGNGTYGALDFGYTSATTYPDASDYGRMVIHGTVTIDSVSRVRTGGTLHVACCENSSVSFNGGFNASSGNGSIVQVAATAEEGNASGTCANAFIEFSPINPAVTLSLASNARIALGNAAATYTVSSSAASLEFVADKATAFSRHVLVQTLPAITTSTATIRLTGDGTVALPSTAPAYPIEFAGAPLVIATNAPVALVAGSSVTVPTTVGVEDLAAGTAATIFTGADSSFDVSKISVKPAHNGVPFGDAAVASLSGTDVVTAGVPAYVSYGWVEPYIVAKALIWLDASDVANFEFKDNTFGYVTTWKDRSAYKRDATAYTIASHDPNWGTLTVTNGVPAYCMGACDSGIDLAFSVRMTTIRTVFWAMSICQDSRAFFLGDSSTYRFHRGGSGQYCYNNSSALWKNGKIYCDGVLVTDNLNTLVPTDRHVYSTVTAANCESNRLTLDRNSGSYSRHGGRELSELIALPDALSDADRNAIEAYLAAKWMGANPSAAGTEGTYVVTGDLAVDDHVGGDKNLTFGEEASVSVVNPTSTGAMVATTGAVTIPAGSPLAVSVDASNLAPGTYTVMQAGSGITDISQFNATATVGAGASASFAVVDGNLVMTITATSSATSQTWRPASSADIGWNATSANWLYDGGTTGGFIPYVPAFIDGAETATGDITVSGEMTAGPITLTGANDYTFKGTGTIAGGDKVTFGGTGTITLDGANFGGQDIVITNGQKVVLGFNAGPNSLGTDSGSSGGKVTITEGSQFNVNDTLVVGGNTNPRCEITQLKTFVIAGDGADGRGALVNDVLDGRTSHSYANAALRRVELADDATIGGSDRLDLRTRGGTAATATPGIYGPGKTLTIKNSVWFASWSQPIDVGAIVIPAGGMFLPVQMTEAMFNVPGGITLDGGLIDHYQNTYPANMPFHVTANGGTFQSGGGASTVKGDVNVASGATLALTGDQNVTYSGAFNANGAAITHSNSATTYFTGTSSGNLDITQTAGTVQLQNKVEGTMAVTKSGGDLYLRTGFSNDTVNVTQTGGNFRFYTEATAPVFDTLNVNATAGTIYIQPQSTSVLIDVPGTIALGESARNVYVYGPANNKGIKIKVTGKSAQFGPVCDTTNPGTVYLKSGTDLNATDFACGNVVSKPARGHMIIEEGAKVTVRNRFMNAYWAGVPAAPATHRIDIYGEVDATGYTAYLTLDGVRGETYLHDGGVFKFKTLTVTRLTTLYPYGTGVGAGDGRQWFIMDGGHLELAALSASALPGCTKIDFQNGTVVNTASYGTSQGVPLFFGYESVGGEVEFNLPSGGYVNLNTGLSGASAVTVKGNGDIGGTRTGAVWQGALLGKIALETTGTTTNDLCNASVFAGGLALADGASAKVGKYADTLYPFAVSIASKVSNRDKLVTNDWSYAYGAADAWGYLHKRYTTGKPYGNYPSQGMRCEFYVPAEKAGTWTFCGAYDDYMFVQIDDTAVFNQAYNALAAHQVTLSAGWHKLAVATYDGTGNCGAPASNGWNDGKTLGFIIGESTSTAGGDYTKFEPGASLGDGLTLQVRPAVNACVWKWINAKPAASTWNTVDNWAHIKCIDSVAQMHLSGTGPTTDTAGLYSGKINVFEGWFKVEDGKEGSWSFKLAYDDYHLLKIDGVQLLGRSSSTETKTGSTTLTAGWHRWEVRVSDGGGGGWGPNNINGGMTLSYQAPGESAYSRFDETNLKLAATLGDIAVLEPSGIYKDLELGAGSTLTSSGTMAMPICGTLKGTGTLAGAWEFAGTTNCWEATCTGNSKDLTCATFSAATPATFAGLKSVKVTFDAKPTRRAYFLTGAIDGLTAADVPDATVIAIDGVNDYTGNFVLTVKNGRLALANSKSGGVTIIVR